MGIGRRFFPYRAHLEVSGAVHGGKYRIVARCPSCRRHTALEAPVAGMRAWVGGELIQNALPELNDAERELLITGTCAACWQVMEELAEEEAGEDPWIGMEAADA